MIDHDASSTTSRIGLGTIAVGAITALLVPFLLLWSRLPDPIASHFDSSGRADGSMTRGAMLGVCGVLVALGTIPLMTLSLRRAPLPEGVAAFGAFLAGVLAMLGAGIAAHSAWAQRDLTTWRDAESNMLAMVVITGGAMAVGAVAARLALKLPRRLDAGAHAAPTMTLGPGEHAVWVGRITNRPFQVTGIALVGIAVLAAFRLAWPLSVIALGVGAAALALSRLQVIADRTGVTVRYGVLAWPRSRIALDDIESASSIDVRPMKWGGWGYRGSLRLAKRAAVVLRVGDGLRLDLTRGRVFVITVDAPGPAVALLSAELTRRSDDADGLGPRPDHTFGSN